MSFNSNPKSDKYSDPKDNTLDSDNEEVETKKQEVEKNSNTNDNETKEEEAESLDNDDTKYIIESEEGKRFTLIGRKVISLSGFLKKTFPPDEPMSGKPPRLNNITSDYLGKIVDYLKHHKGKEPVEIPKPLPSSKLSDIDGIDDWDVKFMESLTQDELFGVLLAANFMDVKPLLNLCCAKTASLMKGKTPKEIKDQFNIKDDYTKEEEEELKKMHKELLEGDNNV